MDWFRWYSGSVADPKFQLVARRASVSVAVVIAIWAVVLERANDNEERGSCDGLDFESLDVALGLDDGVTERVYQLFESRNIIVGDFVANWDKRQPLYEDTTNAERQRRYRQRRKEQDTVTLHNVTVTEDNGMSRQVTTEEIRREEKRKEKETSSSSSSFSTSTEERASDPVEEATLTTTKKADLFQVRVWHEQYFNALFPGGLNNAAGNLCRRFPAAAIEAAFEAAARYGVPKFAYVEAVLTGEKRGRASPQRKGIDWGAVENIRKEGGIDGYGICATGA